jgi:hypothetical protein
MHTPWYKIAISYIVLAIVSVGLILAIITGELLKKVMGIDERY